MIQHLESTTARTGQEISVVLGWAASLTAMTQRLGGPRQGGPATACTALLASCGGGWTGGHGR